jgi:hypothetical protein
VPSSQGSPCLSSLPDKAQSWPSRRAIVWPPEAGLGIGPTGSGPVCATFCRPVHAEAIPGSCRGHSWFMLRPSLVYAEAIPSFTEICAPCFLRSSDSRVSGM